MKKERVVRQNRCDEEMSFLLFLCLFVFVAMQLFADASVKPGLVNAVNLGLYMISVPGFFFCLGYRYGRMRRMNSGEYRGRWLGVTALRYYVYFFVLALLSELRPNLLAILKDERKDLLLSALSDVLCVLRIPSVAALFFSMALLLVLVRLFDGSIVRLVRNRNRIILAAVLFLLCSFLRTPRELYPVAASFFGSDMQAAVPCAPYFAFFLFGVWFEEEKPGFRWKLALLAAAVTAVSLLAYRTPLQNLCRVTASFLPVYLIYLTAEGLSELTLRFGAARDVCRAAEPVFAVCALLAMGLASGWRFGKLSVPRTLLLAAAFTALAYAGFLCLRLLFRWYELAAQRLERRTKRRTALYFLIYTVVFAILLFLVFFVFIWHGKTLLWRADSVSQYYPRAVYFANYIRELVSNFLHGNFELPMYDFRFGMGSEVVYSMEPLYFLVALFGAENAEIMHTVLILLRFYFAGITASIFFLYFKKDYFTTFLASVVYVFCGFSLFGGARHPMFMVPMIFLPLLIIAIEEILRGRRWYLCTLLVALALFSNYYFLYMSTFGMGVYFLVRYFLGPWKKSLKGFIGKGLVISGSYLLGAAMACIILASNFGLYVGSGRSGGAIIKTPSLFYYSAEWLLRCFMSFPTTANAPGDWLRLGFLPLSFFAVVFLFLRRGRRELKALSVIAAVCMALPLSGFVLSGFSSVTNRWCYMLALLTAYIVADCLPDMLRMSKRELAVCAAAAVVYGYFAFFGNYLDTAFAKLAFVLLGVNFAALLLAQESSKLLSRYGKQCMLVLLTFAMVFHSGFTLFQLNEVVGEYAKAGEAQRLAGNTPLLATEELGDDSFYRVGSPQLDYYTISSSIMYDYNSIYMFNSTLNGSIMEYMEKMGATTYSVTQFMGLNNRAFMNALAAVKYYANYTDNTRPLPYGYEELLRTEANGQETVVSENKYALPLGYTYREAMSEEELEGYDVLSRQEAMMQRVVLDSAQAGAWKEKTGEPGGELSLTAQPVRIGKITENGLRISEDGMTASAEYLESAEDEAVPYTAKLKFEGQPDSETYLVLKNAWIEGDMSEEPINLIIRVGEERYRYKFRPDDDRYGTQQQDYVFNLGYHEEPVTSCTLRFDREGTIQYKSLEMYCQPMDGLEKYTQELTEDVLENVSLDTNRVSGEISLDEDKLLVLSIPFQNGWTAYVDGKEAQLLRANYMYMALPLEAGDHRIELSFEIPGVKYALVIMPGAVVLFIILCFITWIVRKRRDKKKGTAGGRRQE